MENSTGGQPTHQQQIKLGRPQYDQPITSPQLPPRPHPCEQQPQQPQPQQPQPQQPQPQQPQPQQAPTNVCQIQEVIDVFCPLTSCLTPTVSKYDETSNCWIGCAAVLSCCCLYTNLTPSRTFIDPKKHDPNHFDRAYCTCIPGTESAKLQEKYNKRLKKAGFTPACEDSNIVCYIMGQLCCQPCLAQKRYNVLSYIYQKRWGVQLTKNAPVMRKDMENQSTEMFHYYDEAFVNPSHPNGRTYPLFYSLFKRKYGVIRQVQYEETRREQNLDARVPRTPLLHEYYKLDACIAEHNKFWGGIHHISGVTMQ